MESMVFCYSSLSWLRDPQKNFVFSKYHPCICIFSWPFYDPISLFPASFKLAIFDFSGRKYGASLEKFFSLLKNLHFRLILFWNFDLEFFKKRISCSVHGCFWIFYLYKPCHQLRSGGMHIFNKSLLLSVLGSWE